MRVAVPLLLASVAAGCASNPKPAASPSESVQTTHIMGAGGGTSAIATLVSPSSGTTQIDAPIDRAWAALRAAYDTLGIPVSTVDEPHHLLGNTGWRLRRRLGRVPLSRLLDCGSAQGAPNAESYEILLAIATQLQPAAGSTGSVATTSVQASAKPVNFAGEYVNCSSTGGLENRIGDTVKRILLH